MKATQILLVSLVLCLCLPHLLLGGTSGKISGIVKDAQTGEALINANVVIVGTTMGAATGSDGYYTIVNVPPGTYRLRASLIGYTATTLVDVRVDIDHTTQGNLTLTQEGVSAQEVVVVAQRPVVQKDVAASRMNIGTAEIAALPSATIAGVVGLQAGITTTGDGGFQIRHGGVDQTQVTLDGLTIRDGRTNEAYTGFSLTSIEDVQVQTGGWNAEYGNVRSGLVNVVTKEGSKTNYSFQFQGRYRPVQQKYFGNGPSDPRSYWLRPFLDPAVCWTGTNNGAWDAFTQKQYPIFTGGWNAVSKATLATGNPSQYLSPEAARQLFLFQHRKQTWISNPDYDIDMNLGGPMVPDQSITEKLGNLRFNLAYRKSTNYYMVPLSTDAWRDYSGTLKVTSDLARNMKLVLEGMISRTTGTNDNNSGLGGVFTTASDLALNGFNYANGSYRDAALYGTDYWAPTTIDRRMAGGKFTHFLSEKTFYEVALNTFWTKYRTAPNPYRDTTKAYYFGTYAASEAPFGFPAWYAPVASGIGSNMNMDLGWSGSRDSTDVAVIDLRASMSSQIDRYNYLQGGIELIYTDNNAHYYSIDERLRADARYSFWHTFPLQGAVYVQDKIEFEGMIANLGVRVDYSDPRGKWFAGDTYASILSDARSLDISELLTQPVKKQVTFSPRVGIAFPISDVSKLFFNYGHFRSLPAPEDLFLIRRAGTTQSVVRLANPNNAFPRTIQYELGYEQSIADEFLLRAAGYYKDVSLENYLVRYVSQDGSVNYTSSTPNSYEDIRGFEFTATKNRGNWIQGFVNYTYDVITSGYFGYAYYYQNAAQQREYIANNVYQSKPTPRPYGRANIDFFTPPDFGPDVAGISLLGDWRLNLTGSWFSGQWFTWAGPGGSGGTSIVNNVEWTDSWGLDMRLSKNFRISHLNLEFFVDAINLLNLKQMGYQMGFSDSKDLNDYMMSLHLPADIAGDETNPKLGYVNHPGNDRPGDYRKVDYKPYDPNNPNPSDKSYIDMPNIDYLAFLNPRAFYYGIRFSYDF